MLLHKLAVSTLVALKIWGTETARVLILTLKFQHDLMSINIIGGVG